MRSDIEHLHAHFSINAASIAFVLSRILNISFSFTAHNIFFTDRLILKEKIVSAKFIAAISEFSKDYLLQLVPGGEIAKKIHIVHCGLSPEQFSPSKSNLPAQLPRLLFVAQLAERKGAPYLIEACRLLALQGLDFECNLIGDGHQRAELEKLITDYGIGDRVKLLRALPQEEVKKLLASTDIFILPCIIAEDGDMDGIPVSLMEAMSMGIPVISTRISGIPELISNRESGILVEEKNAAELSEAILQLIHDSELREQLAVNGRQKIEKEFNIHKTSAEIGELFQHYIGPHNDE